MNVIEFSHVYKHYHLGSRTSLREALTQTANNLLRRNQSEPPLFCALDDVSFNVEQGIALGIIGRNGAGKSTILKLLSRVSYPTRGKIYTRGRIAALIELGAGFHPDLSGRENVYLNGSFLGIKKHDIDVQFDNIVEFAELEKFIDTPVKRYSSGMYARLAFAVAAHVDPEILLVDEVLAVGDERFQRKCFGFIHAFVKSGKTTVFVSHNLFAIEQLCDRVILLDNGKIAVIGEPSHVASAYMDIVNQQQMIFNDVIKSENEEMNLVRVNCVDEAGNEKDTFASGEDLIIRAEYIVNHPIHNPHFHFSIADAYDSRPLFHASMLVDGDTPPTITGKGVIRCHFKALPLMPKVYQIWGEVYSEDRVNLLVSWQKMGTFRINFPDQVIGRLGVRHLRADASIKVPYQWEWGNKFD